MTDDAPTTTPPALAGDAVEGWRRVAPNALTVGRIVLAWVAIAMVSIHGADAALAAGLVFALAAATDALDGYLASRWRAASALGRILDPLADKILVLGGFIVLAGPWFTVLSPDEAARSLTGVHPWMVGVLLTRELLVNAIRHHFESIGIAFGALASGKAKMVVQSIAVPVVLVLVGLGRTDGVWSVLIDAVVWLTLGVTVASAVPYVFRAWSLRDREGAR